ncbi:MAG: hypothetical protein H3C69_02405 [Candidatus Promineofilum sp.]|nr:hypothetical protein [Promineifilum sp.]
METQRAPEGENGSAAKSRYSLIAYNTQSIEDYSCRTIDELLERIDLAKINWITVRGVHDKAELLRLLAYLKIDEFILPDLLDESQSKFEVEYDNCLYLEYIAPYLGFEARRLVQAKGAFILTANAIILYEYQPYDLFSRTRRRILNRQTHVMEYGPDYLLYLLIRAVIVDYFQHAFKILAADLETLEDKVLAGRGREDVYRNILDAREYVKPWNDPLLELEDFLEYVKDAESKFITDRVTKYFTKSLLREVGALLNHYDRLRGILKEIISLHMSNIERNTGRVNQLLTVIATVFLPITFIASIYGMNFKYMPELEKPWGYPAVLILMAVVAMGLLIFMRRRRWF